MRVRRRGRASLSIDLRACSTAAAPKVPSPGTWLRRSVPGAAGLGDFADAPLVIVIARLPLPIGVPANKKPSPPGEGPFGLRWWRLASVPPSSSVLPPGAGNKPEKAIQPEERAKNLDERYVEARMQRHGNSAAVARDDDGNMSAVPAVEHSQTGLPQRLTAGFPVACRAVYGASNDRATCHTPPERTVAAPPAVARSRFACWRYLIKLPSTDCRLRNRPTDLVTRSPDGSLTNSACRAHERPGSTVAPSVPG